MGVIQSVFCSFTFCLERVLTWTSCAFGLILLMASVVVMMIYGISVGYHYAQKELTAFAISSKTTTDSSPSVAVDGRRAGGGAADLNPVVRFLAVNRSDSENFPAPIIEIYRSTSNNPIFMEPSVTPIVLLETERPPKSPELSPHEKELARRLIGRFRRSQNNVTPFLRPLKNMTLI